MDVTSALPTLDPATSKAGVEDAKSCKAPLAWVALVKQPGSGGGMVRVSSGSYLSPAFQLTDAPQAYRHRLTGTLPTGRGVLSLIGGHSILSAAKVRVCQPQANACLVSRRVPCDG
jgi:hypothetical protein